MAWVPYGAPGAQQVLPTVDPSGSGCGRPPSGVAPPRPRGLTRFEDKDGNPVPKYVPKEGMAWPSFHGRNCLPGR